MIDFSGVQGNQGNSFLLPEATFTNTSGGDILVGSTAAGEADGFCFLGLGCQADGEMIFGAAVENLFFDIDGADVGDSVEISAFDGANTLLGSVIATVNGQLDFSGFGAITRLVFDDSSTAAGVGYSTFTFDFANGRVGGGGGSSVSAPATLLLMLSSMLGFRLMRKK